MLQRLRDAEDDIRFGEFSGKEGDIVSGIIQQGRNPDDVMVDLGKLEALLPMGERAPGERYVHGARIKCLVVSVRKGMRGPQITLVALPPQPGQEAVRARGARDRRRHRRDRRHRARGRSPHQDRGPLHAVRRQRQGRLHRAHGTAGAQRDVGAPRREDRHRRLVRRPEPSWSPTRCHPRASTPSPSSTRTPGPHGSWCPTSSCRWRSARRARTPASRPASPAGASTSAATRTTGRQAVTGLELAAGGLSTHLASSTEPHTPVALRSISRDARISPRSAHAFLARARLPARFGIPRSSR